VNFDAAWQLHDQLGRRLRGKPGQVHTPRDIAIELARLTLAPLPNAPTLLDPACGCGALLLGALEWAATHRPHWLESWQLHGWDIDPASVRACNRVLAAAGWRGAPAAELDGLSQSGAYDAVLANPPWVSYSGRHAVPISAARKVELAAAFPAFSGWPALHTAFAEQCARLTCQDGGRMGLLLPMQMADLAGYAAARRAVTARLALEHAIDLGERAFSGVTEPAGLFVFSAGSGVDRAWLPDRDALLLSSARRFSPLPAECFGDIGVHTGNAGDLLVTTEPEGRPLRTGRDVRPFRLDVPTHYLRDVELPPGRYARVGASERFQRAVILLRQTADRPVAARHEPWALFRNSVLACFGAPGHDVDFLLGVLNSDAAARIHRALFRDARQRSFPQVKVAHLRALPVPGREIGPLYDRIANASRDVQGGANPADLYALVNEAYGL
jgi:hypothetical protein